MANIIYKYPMSSCGTSYVPDCNLNRVPTNMSVNNCNFSPQSFREPFRQNIQPVPKKGIVPLNPQILVDNYATDYYRFKHTDPTMTALRSPEGGMTALRSPEGGMCACPSEQYTSTDPRLISAKNSGQVLTFDRPPIGNNVLMDEVPDLIGYGQNYNTYSDVNGGQIMYYNDRSIEDPYFNPLFVSSASVDGFLYKDPMGAIKPQYSHRPLKNDNPIGPTRNNYQGCLSWIQDSTGFREDIMAHQMAKRNQERWSPRWSVTN